METLKYNALIDQRIIKIQISIHHWYIIMFWLLPFIKVAHLKEDEGAKVFSYFLRIWFETETKTGDNSFETGSKTVPNQTHPMFSFLPINFNYRFVSIDFRISKLTPVVKTKLLVQQRAPSTKRLQRLGPEGS